MQLNINTNVNRKQYNVSKPYTIYNVTRKSAQKSSHFNPRFIAEFVVNHSLLFNRESTAGLAGGHKPFTRQCHLPVMFQFRFWPTDGSEFQ